LPNRYGNLTPSKSISKDYQTITLGFDRVQGDMDSVMSTGTSLQTKITDHINAAVAHTAQQIADSVPGLSSTNVHALFVELLAKVNTIITGTSPTKDAELVDIRNLTPGYVPFAPITAAGDVTRDIQKRLIAAATQAVAMKYGWNYVLTDQASPLDYVINGRTLANILGKEGNCESLTGWTTGGTVATSTTQVKSGTTSFKVTNAGAGGFANKNFSYTLDTTKQYILGAWVYVESWTSGTIGLRLQDIDGTDRYAANANSATIGSWQYIYVKIPTSHTILGTGFRLTIGSGSVMTWTAYFDSIRLYELSVADYNAIGTTYTATSTPSIDDFIPYVDSVKHLTNPGIRLPGKNLLPPFTEWVMHANAVVTEPYKLTLNATANFQQSYSTVDVIPNTAYTVQCTMTSGARIVLQWLDAAGSSISFTAALSSGQSVTSPSNAKQCRFLVDNGVLSGNVTFSNPQFELGSIATAFEPQNNDYAYIPVTLASNSDGSVRDSFDSRLGTVLRRWKTDVALDGSLTWAYLADDTGYKAVNTSLTGAKINTQIATKYDGKILGTILDSVSVIGQSADKAKLDSLNLALTIADSDSGWGESYTPSAAEIKAYFYGWKMNNGTFGTAYNGSGTKTWVPINATSNTGAVTTVPTTPSTAITSGAYDYYRLSYQLATPVTETVIPEGSLGLHSGGNQLEVLSGVILREKANIVYSSSYGRYYINQLDGSDPAVPSGSQLKNRASRIFAIYRNGQLDLKWSFGTDNKAYGNQRASISPADYDPTAEYTVTYQALDRYQMTTNVVDMTGYYNTNPKTVIDSLVQDMADVTTMASINARQMAEVYKRLKALGG
jgi:hypothetical protein